LSVLSVPKEKLAKLSPKVIYRETKLL